VAAGADGARAAAGLARLIGAIAAAAIRDGEPQTPTYDVVTNTGEIVVPVDAIPTTAIDPPHRAASPAVPALIGRVRVSIIVIRDRFRASDPLKLNGRSANVGLAAGCRSLPSAWHQPGW
jgi:hypothetical protein